MLKQFHSSTMGGKHCLTPWLMHRAADTRKNCHEPSARLSIGWGSEKGQFSLKHNSSYHYTSGQCVSAVSAVPTEVTHPVRGTRLSVRIFQGFWKEKKIIRKYH